MRLALEDPESMSRLVNIHSPGLPQARLHALRTALKVPGLRSGLAWFVRQSPRKWAWRNVHYWDESLKSLEEAEEYGRPLADADGSMSFVRYLAETLDPAQMSTFVAQLEARRSRDESFPVPLMLIYSRQDPMVPPEVGERLAKLVPNDRMVWLDDTSHFAHVDSPERLLEPTVAFLREGA